MITNQPLLLVVCGPNGSGKSTLRHIISAIDRIPFIDPDEIAAQQFREHAAARAYEAAKIAEALRAKFFELRRSFGFETVLSDPVGEKVQFLREVSGAGYWVAVHFVGLNSPELSRARVFQRVNEGGHDVPDDKLFARYPRVIENLHRLLNVPDDLVIYDNSSTAMPFRIIARLSKGLLLEVAGTIPNWAQALDLSSHRIQQTRTL